MIKANEVVATLNAIENENAEVIASVEQEKKEQTMKNFSFTYNEVSNSKAYDNQGAYDTLQEMMKRKEQLTVKFYSGKDNIPCALIESAHVAKFKYQLKNESFNGLLNYLFTGEVVDFDKNPMDIDTIDENVDFQFSVMKMMIHAGKRIQFVPLFRERLENISAILPCFKGNVMFRIKRTDEALEYLRENNQII